MSEISRDAEKQTQVSYLAFYQHDGEKKWLFFEENGWQAASQSGFWKGRLARHPDKTRTNPNKPKRVKGLGMSKIIVGAEKQTH